jgi:hypothetical protein
MCARSATAGPPAPTHRTQSTPMNEWAGASAFVIAKAPSFARFAPLFFAFRRVRFFRFTANVLRYCSCGCLFYDYWTKQKMMTYFLLSQICFRFLCSFCVPLTQKFVEWQKELQKFMVKICDIS